MAGLSEPTTYLTNMYNPAKSKFAAALLAAALALTPVLPAQEAGALLDVLIKIEP